MRRLRCWFGLHQYGAETWRWEWPGEAYYWFRRCEHCYKIKKTSTTKTPPSHFIRNKYGVLQEVLNGAPDE